MSHPRWIDLLATLAPGIALALLFVALFALFLTRPAARDDNLRRDGSALMPRVFIAFWYWLITPLIERLARLGVRPNHITLFSLFIALVASVALGLGWLMLGAWLLVAAASCDLLDGLLARKTGGGSKAGAFLDSFADRCAESLVFGGIAYYGAGGWLTGVAVWAMIASLLVSYARARAQALDVDCAVGLMQRPERMLLLILTLFAAPIVAAFRQPEALDPNILNPVTLNPINWVAVGGVGLLALLSTLTALSRARWTLHALSDGGDARRKRGRGANQSDSEDSREQRDPHRANELSLESKAEAAR
jgi:CDP-diacylglycerol--glycerol-3-phosphate 3-phosphatidyltransferase